MEKKLKWPDDFLNIKCVIYTIYIALLYWLLPRKPFFLFLSTIINYFMINWYNYSYLCEYNNLFFNIFYAITVTILLIYLPIKNKVILGFSLYFPYFILAWYDYFANCSFRMNPTLFPFGRYIFLPMKPESYQRRYDTLDPIVKKNIANFDKYIFVSVLVGFVFIFLYKFIL